MHRCDGVQEGSAGAAEAVAKDATKRPRLQQVLPLTALEAANDEVDGGVHESYHIEQVGASSEQYLATVSTASGDDAFGASSVQGDHSPVEKRTPLMQPPWSAGGSQDARADLWHTESVDGAVRASAGPCLPSVDDGGLAAGSVLGAPLPAEQHPAPASVDGIPSGDINEAVGVSGQGDLFSPSANSTALASVGQRHAGPIVDEKAGLAECSAQGDSLPAEQCAGVLAPPSSDSTTPAAVDLRRAGATTDGPQEESALACPSRLGDAVCAARSVHGDRLPSEQPLAPPAQPSTGSCALASVDEGLRETVVDNAVGASANACSSSAGDAACAARRGAQASEGSYACLSGADGKAWGAQEFRAALLRDGAHPQFATAE